MKYVYLQIAHASSDFSSELYDSNNEDKDI